jgi:hypothetical protein
LRDPAPPSIALVDDLAQSRSPETISEKPTIAELTTIDPSWLEDFQQYLYQGDIASLRIYLDRLDAIKPDLSKKLRNLVEQFAFEELIELTEKIK